RRDTVLDQGAAAKAPPCQPEGERDADQESEHRRCRADLQAAKGGVDPGRVVKVTSVPFEREAGRRKAQIASRAERDRKQHQQRQHQERKDEPADGAQKYPPRSHAAPPCLPFHPRRLTHADQSLRWRATPWFSSQNIRSVSASRITESA